MKITDIKVYPLEISKPSSTPERYLQNAKVIMDSGLNSKFSYCFIELLTDEDLSGIGEAFARKVPTAHAEIMSQYIRKLLVGKDPLSIGYLWELIYSSILSAGYSGGHFLESLSAVDIALWDIFGKKHKEPVYKLLGGPYNTSFRAYASGLYWKQIEGFTLDHLVSRVEEVLKKGYKQVKIKIGIGKMIGKPNIDFEAIRFVREKLGYDFEIMVDANCAFSRTEALRIGRVLERYEVSWIEEPLQPWDTDGYVELSRNLDTPIAAGESLSSRVTFKEFLTKHAIDIAQPDITRCGGITEFIRIANLCETFGINVAPHIGWGSPCCKAASLHACAAISPNTLLAFEHMQSESEDPAATLFTRNMEDCINGYSCVRNGHGLGIEFRSQVAVHHVVEDYRSAS